MESSFKSLDDAGHRALHLSSVLRVPNIMSNELFNGFPPLVLEMSLVSHNFQLIHKSIHILYQNIISCDQHFLLLTGSFSLLACWYILLRISCWVLILSLQFVRCSVGWVRVVGNTGQRSLLPFLLLAIHCLRGPLVVDGIRHTSLDSVEAHGLFSFFVWSRLDLSWSPFVQVLWGGVNSSILIHFLILFVCCWR